MTSGEARSRASRDPCGWRRGFWTATACAGLCACGRPDAPRVDRESLPDRESGTAIDTPAAEMRAPVDATAGAIPGVVIDAAGPTASAGAKSDPAPASAGAALTDAGHAAPIAKRLGAACGAGQAGACGPGLACCETGFHGHCGGAMPTPEEMQRDPCVVVSTCSPAPCRPMQYPP